MQKLGEFVGVILSDFTSGIVKGAAIAAAFWIVALILLPWLGL